MSVDTIGNFITIIRNGLMVSKPSVEATYSKMRYAVAQILKEEGFVRDVIVTQQENNKKGIKVILKYVDGESAIHRIERQSTPGRRVYTSVDEIEPVIGGLGISILSTNAGVISHKQAKQQRVGGELICTVW
jgi:small subunit ribosomal protein S8